MAFGIGILKDGKEAGPVQGKQIEIACECWFTAKGRTKPLMIKIQDENGAIQTIDEIKVNYSEEKNYSGIRSVEYDCTITYDGVMYDVKLIFFKEECRWVLRSI